MITRILRLASMFAFLALLSAPTSGQPASSEAGWVNALRDGGFVIVFRHGATHQDQADFSIYAAERPYRRNDVGGN